MRLGLLLVVHQELRRVRRLEPRQIKCGIGARWRVSGVPKHGKGAASLADAVSQAIADQGIALGRGHSGRGTRP